MIIPARLDSTRLPKKLLKRVNSKTVIQHVYEKVLSMELDLSIYVATDSVEVVKEVDHFGGNAVMTRDDHISGTDRVFEAASKLALSNDDVVINIQGDEPLMPKEYVKGLSDLFSSREDFDVATVACPVEQEDYYYSADKVKVVLDRDSNAMYFSRSPIPFNRDEKDTQFGLHHVGIYGYTYSALSEFVNYPSGCELEKAEKLEQLRFLWLGRKIKVLVKDNSDSFGIDTQEDFDKFAALIGGK